MARGLTDSHVHLHAYSDAEISAMLSLATAAGVETVVAVSVDLASARRTVALARQTWPLRVVAAVGLHPSRLQHLPDEETWAELEALASDTAVCAVGECGVDALESHTSGIVQLTALARQARLAARLGKPILLHLRGDDLIGPALGALAAAGLPPEYGIVHYFSGDAALARRYLDAGLMISVGKPVTRHENVALRAAVASGIPMDRLLIETDSYPVAGRLTEPADVRLVAEALAELRETTATAVADATTANLERLLVGRPARG